jgi:hypothetical protein
MYNNNKQIVFSIKGAYALCDSQILGVLIDE